jgi:hypothetical protein
MWKPLPDQVVLEIPDISIISFGLMNELEQYYGK